MHSFNAYEYHLNTMAGSYFKVCWLWTKANINSVLKALPELNHPIYHICSGCSDIGDVRLDMSFIKNVEMFREHRGTPTLRGDMTRLPFKSGVAGSVICDPPYYYDFTDSRLIDELVRICKPKAKILFIAPWIPANKNISLINTEVWKVGKNRPYVKIRSLLYKSNGQLSDYA